MKTSELIGPALDWAVREALLKTIPQPELGLLIHQVGYGHPAKPYSTDWAQGGPIIERENIFTYPSDLLGHGFSASKWKQPLDVKIGNEFICKVDYAPTRLIAAMRCYVVSELGDEIEIPEELT
jgi:hypothetical protein